MALTQVRAKIGGEWLTLTLNEATGRYEAQTTAQGTSYHQPGGYWPGEAEATDEAGETVTVTADKMAGLRFLVREETAPTLTLISPSPGYLLSQAVTLVFEAADETGGSGVDPDSFSLEGAAAEAIPNGYRFTWTAAWTDGPHTVTASVSDYDGNLSTVSGAYLVDTVPPELYVQEPCQRHVTDAETVLVSGVALDTTSGVGAVTVAGEAVPVASGRFEKVVPLDVGENTIPITVTDQAGNATSGSVYMIRLITDRTQADVSTIENLYVKLQNGTLWTETEKEWFLTGLAKGAYNDEDLNRVTTAYKWLAGELQRRGYIANVQDIPINHVVQILETDENGDYVTVEIDGELYYVVKEVKRWTDQTWIEDDAPTQPQMQTYLQNVETVRSAQKLPVPPIPNTMRKSTVEDWNSIEKALVETDALFPKYFVWTAGELSAGGF